MLLTMAVAIGIGGACLEIWFFRAIPLLHRLITSNQAIDIAASFAITFLLSGGNGPTAVLAGTISTVLTTVYWRFEERYEAHRAIIEERKAEAIQLAKDLFRVIYITLRILTAPIRGARWVHRTYKHSAFGVWYAKRRAERANLAC